MSILQRIRQAVRTEHYRISAHIMNRDQCEFCDGVMEHRRMLVRFRYKGQTIYVEHVPVWVCVHCGEQYFDAPVYKQLEAIARQQERITRQISFPLAEFEMAMA